MFPIQVTGCNSTQEKYYSLKLMVLSSLVPSPPLYSIAWRFTFVEPNKSGGGGGGGGAGNEARSFLKIQFCQAIKTKSLALMLLSLASELLSPIRATRLGRAPASNSLYLPFVMTAILAMGKSSFCSKWGRRKDVQLFDMVGQLRAV